MTIVIGVYGLEETTPESAYDLLKWAWEDAGQKSNPVDFYAANVLIATLYWYETESTGEKAIEEARANWGNIHLRAIHTVNQ